MDTMRLLLNKDIQSTQQLRVIIDTMPVAAGRCDRQGRFRWVNPTYAKWAARSAEDIVGSRIQDVIGPAPMDLKFWPGSVLASRNRHGLNSFKNTPALSSR